MTYPFIGARWFTRTNGRRVDLIVWHDAEIPERPTAAEDLARYFATTDRQASAHFVCDVDSTVQCVHERDVAYHAPGANNNGIGVELAGYAAQVERDWLDDYSRAMLVRQAAPLGADLTKRHGIPVTWLSPGDLRAGARGHTSHANVSAAFRKSDHTDPGPGFPAGFLLAEINRIVTGGQPMPPAPPRPGYEDQGPFVWVKASSPEEAFWRSYLPVSRLAASHRVAVVNPAAPPPGAGKTPLVYAPVPGWGGSRLGPDRKTTLENMLFDAFAKTVDL